MKNKKFIQKFENPDYPLLGPSLTGLQLWKMWHPEANSINFISKYYLHVLATIFVISQYIELYLIRDNLELALRNLSVTMLSSICVIKAISFVRWEKYWNSLFKYITKLEKLQTSKGDSVTASVIADYTKYSRKLTYFYWSLVTGTVLTVIFTPLVGYISSPKLRYLIRNGTAPCPEILSSWLPFDRTRGYGYWVSILEHSSICVYGGGVVAAYDSMAVVLMSFLNGQLKILRKNCERLFDDDGKTFTYKESVKRIGACHVHHTNLVKFSSMLDSLLSPVMFIYVIICSLMICASAVQLTTEGTGTMQRIWIAEYLVALIAQLFLYCWHSNEVLYMSKKVEQGVYESAWWSQNVRVRRSVLLLAGQLRKHIVLKAGPFTNLSVPTFVAVLKGAYSYYTLLSKREK